MQAGSDQFLGAITGRDIDNHLHDYYARQLRDGKGSVVVEALGPKGMKTYAALCGRTLGRAHARTASRHAIAAYLDGNEDFDEAITEFALSYAAINDSDHAAMIEAIASAGIEAAELV